MPQLYCQQSSRPDPWLIGRTSAGLCTLQTACPLTVTYSGGGTDTIAAGSAATIYGGSAAAFDAATDVWVVLTVPASGALQVTKEADLATVTGDWAGLARIVQHAVEPYQPQAYLGSGGAGGTGVTTTTTLASLAGQGKVHDLGAGGSPPAGWTAAGFDDSAWAVPVLEAGGSGGVLGPAIGGTQWITYLAGDGVPALEDWLFRAQVTLPVGAVTSATLAVWADNTVVNAYVNGTSVVAGYTASFMGSPTSVDISALLVPGAVNTLAMHVKNDATVGVNPSSLDFLLSATGSLSGAVDPTSAEGDLIYRHSGALTRLPIGTSGDVLTSNGTDPYWAADTDSSGTVTSIAVAVPAPLSSSGGPITASGTITLAWSSGQPANRVLASPDGTTGTVSLRALVGNDIPVDASTIVSSAGTIKGNYQAGSGVSISGNTISATGSGGSVTSVALSVPSSIFAVAGSPITTSGTLAVSLQTQAAHTVWAGPASGSAAAPTFRTLGGSDLPAAAGAGGHIHAHVHLH